MSDAPSVFHWDQLDWDDPLSGVPKEQMPPKELVEKARRGGAKRKKIVRGEAGFFMNRSQMAAGFRVPPHSHDHDELIVVMHGGCAFSDDIGELGPGDSIVIHAGTRYGFTCGDEGMDFLTIRMGEASVDLSA
jgi:quercetin dioxygenase-like cupin family protein